MRGQKPLVRSSVLIAVLMVSYLPALLLFAGRCCETIYPAPACSGCLQVGVNPNKYVNLGSNSVSFCSRTPLPQYCDEHNKECASLTNTNVYSDASCQNVVGTTSITIYVPSCDSVSDPCSGG